MNRKLPIIIAIVVVLGGAITIVAVNHDSSNNMNMNMSSSASSQSTAKPVATNSVVLTNYAFSPSVITVKVGTKVTWTNKDDVHHTVTADSGTGPASSDFGQGQTYSYTYTKAGTFTYHCVLHPYMHGTVVVTN
jgi:plastocyanin